jgi:hypothetical protein
MQRPAPASRRRNKRAAPAADRRSTPPQMACASVPSSSWRIASVSTATCRRRSPKTSSCPCGSAKADLPGRQRGNVDERTNITFTAEQRLDWLRLIRSENIGPCGIVAQTPPTPARVEGRRGRARGCSSGPGSWVLGSECRKVRSTPRQWLRWGSQEAGWQCLSFVARPMPNHTQPVVAMSLLRDGG